MKQQAINLIIAIKPSKFTNLTLDKVFSHTWQTPSQIHKFVQERREKREEK
jgi:hypothetical protein